MKNIIPICAKSFKSWRLSSLDVNALYNNIGEPIPFDVTLFRQLNNNNKYNFPIDKKKEVYDFIIKKNNPINIEVDIDLKKWLLKKNIDRTKNHFVKVQNLEELMKLINDGSTSFSFTTSVSNSFQLKNSNMTIRENYNNINNMMAFLDDSPISSYNTKLYVDCINTCPIEGKIAINNIVNELVKLHKLKPDKICLIDTCGELEPIQLYSICESLIFNNIDLSIFSMQLRMKPEREFEVEKVFHLALDYGIKDFDVSTLNVYSYMPYNLYYKFLFNYINNKCD